ncbi:hypothetical protein RCC89_20215 [Cytophagaceae bacterium ABcell3]|nr:hypothetical protein RCC89_20215 [Cytophagaceae bacterium ABcell3]
MKNWNKTAKIKALLLIPCALPAFLYTVEAAPQEGILISMIMPLVFTSFATPLLAKYNAEPGKKLIPPAWNDNPLNLANPLPFFQFASFIFLTFGISQLVATLIKFGSFNEIGLISICFGVGMFIGIKFAVLMPEGKSK